jgi:rhamnulokinase
MAATLNTSRLDLTEVERFRHIPVFSPSGLQWDLPRLAAHVIDGMRVGGALLGHQLESFGISTWGVDYALRSAGVMGAPASYLGSALEPMNRVHRIISEQQLFEITGVQPNPINTIYRIAHERPRLPASLVLMPSLFGRLLTGSTVVERSMASTTGLTDVRSGRWSTEIVTALRLEQLSLPTIADTGVRDGCDIELSDVLPELSGCAFTHSAEHDTAAAVLAAPIKGEGAAFVCSGSWSLAGIELDEPMTSTAAREAGFTNERGAFSSFLFMRNINGLSMIERCLRESASEVDLESILDQARSVEPLRSVIALDDSRLAADSDISATIRELCAQGRQPVPQSLAALVRCVLDSLAMAYRVTFRSIHELTGKHIDRINIVGGGSRNEMLCQLTADSCQVEVHAGPTEATSIGNVLAQAICSGEVENVAQAGQIVQSSFKVQVYAPNPQLAAAWEDVDRRLAHVSTERKL